MARGESGTFGCGGLQALSIKALFLARFSLVYEVSAHEFAPNAARHSSAEEDCCARSVEGCRQPLCGSLVPDETVSRLQTTVAENIAGSVPNKSASPQPTLRSTTASIASLTSLPTKSASYKRKWSIDPLGSRGARTLLLYSMMLHCVAFICKALQHKGSAMIARCAQLHPVGLNCTFSGRDCIKWLYKTGDLIRQGSRAFSAIRPVPRQQCLAA